MNAFVAHHLRSIDFVYSCFDRIIFNVIIQRLQYAPSVVRFFQERRQAPCLSRHYFRKISANYHEWVTDWARQRDIPVVEPPKDVVRRDEWLDSFFPRQPPADHQIAVILKARENARVAVSYATRGAPHIELHNRFVDQYYFYAHDQTLGRMFLRICPYFPFNARMYINGHHWLACRLRAEGISFGQRGNGFLTCSRPERLQELADQFGPEEVLACAHRWLAQLVPFFTEPERRRDGFGYHLFVSQAEYCTNLIFHRRAHLDRLGDRLLDLNRAIGRPDKLAIVFGPRISKCTTAHMKTRLIDHHLGHPVLRGEYKRSSIKQYVRDHRLLRVEAATDRTTELGVRKGIEHLPQLRTRLQTSTERYLDIQQDVLETYIDRGQLQRLRQPTVTPQGRRTPGLRLDDLRLLAVMQALTAFAFVAGNGCFRSADLLPRALEALGEAATPYTLARLRYDLAKLRGKGLVHKVAGTQSYRLTPEGYRICVLFLKLFHRIYAPLTAGLTEPVPEDRALPSQRRCMLDQLYVAVDRALAELLDHVGLKTAG